MIDFNNQNINLSVCVGNFPKTRSMNIMWTSVQVFTSRNKTKYKEKINSLHILLSYGDTNPNNFQQKRLPSRDARKVHE